MYGQLSDGHSVCLLNIIDDFNREVLSIEMGFPLPASQVVRAMDQLID